MTGKLTVDYFEGGKLKREVQEGLTAQEASVIVVATMEKYLNVQFTWKRKDGSNG